MEPNNKKKLTISRVVESMASLSGYMIGSILIGMYIDNKFFNNNGISVVVAALIGIIMVGINIVKLVIVSRDN
ncbi:hypothetical protein LJB88_00380 [Erysipelotrichaceae bacterium OttesenSCG-928-M19]|nr:hypothetical protein [Erysipelotrichaceae bacterium OttesenSCG-928-M19]